MSSRKTVKYLEIPPLLINGDDELVDVGDQLVALRLPKAICTLLQELHQYILTKEEGEIMENLPLHFLWDVQPKGCLWWKL